MRTLAALTAALALAFGSAAQAVPHPDGPELQAGRHAAHLFWQHRDPKRAAKCAKHWPHVVYGGVPSGFNGWTPAGPRCRTVHISKSYAKSTSRVRLCSTITHEIGHSLGLHHVSNPRNIMYPQQVQQREIPKACHYPDPHS